jgi:hypothetical protein
MCVHMYTLTPSNTCGVMSVGVLNDLLGRRDASLFVGVIGEVEPPRADATCMRICVCMYLFIGIYS